MDDFSFLSGLFGILFGLIVAEIATKFADAIDRHHRRPIGWLTPMLAIAVLMDAAGFWIWFWSMRSVVLVRWHTVYAGLIVSVVYFLAAALIFPRSEGDWASLDQHYWSRKPLVVGLLLLVEGTFTGWQFSRVRPEWDDWWLYFYVIPYFAALAGLLVSRSRKIDLALLALLIASLISSGSDIFPGSRWGTRIGVNFYSSPSTSAAPLSR